MTPLDVTTFAIASLSFALAAAIGCVLPALRATGLDPLVVMRD